jgi:hypothetical protein
MLSYKFYLHNHPIYNYFGDPDPDDSEYLDGNLLSWVTDYLDDRKQKVVLDGFSSGWEGIDAGVPQGSVLDPFLFLIYINDIVDDLDCNIKLFADDASLYVTQLSKFPSIPILRNLYKSPVCQTLLNALENIL